ncbi:hypothetical protein [Sphingobium phenoxybenzoativorans]|uniref:hypothetical protein n=1 Tax=Sphingobium phenoxybenzoativorans TaxID=1592790 RepID=UPI000872B342|nr:hypothetical protein [Sphingobium phenoxybenzoativorans]
MSLFTALLLAVSPDAVGEIRHYVRSNSDGSEAEAVHVYRKDETTLEVVKIRARCTNAAYVIAKLNPETWEATHLSGGRLLPGAGREAFATLAEENGRIVMTFDRDGRTVREQVAIGSRPWHLYDFDLASLSVATEHLKDPQKSVAFSLALVWLDPARPDDMLHWLGAAQARYTGTKNGLISYAVEGPAFGGEGGGVMQIDAKRGHIVSARFERPNHAEYKDFRLELTGVDRGAAAWRQLLTAHWEGCAGE